MNLDQPTERAIAPSIRRLLFRLIALTFVPAIALVVALVRIDFQERQHRAEAETTLRVRALAMSFREYHDMLVRRAGALGRVLVGPESELRAAGEALVADVNASSLVLYSGEGVRQLAIVNPAAHEGESTPRLPQAPARPDIVFMRGEGEPASHSVSILVPLEGAAQGFAHLRMEPTRFRELLDRQTLPAGWIAAVVDSKGFLVARIPNNEWFTGREINQPLREQLAAFTEGIFDVTTLDGVPVVTAYRQVPESGWAVVVSVPRAALEGPAIRSAVYVASVSSLILAVVLWQAYLLRRRIAHAFERVRAIAGSVGNESVPVTDPLDVREAEELRVVLLESARGIKAATSALELSRQRLTAIVQTASDPIVVADETGIIILFNHAAEAAFHRRSDQMGGLPLEALFDPAGWSAYRRRASGLYAQGQGSSVVLAVGTVCRRSDGSNFSAEVSASVACDPHGMRLHTLIIRDLTDRLRDQEQVLQARLEVERVTRGFQQALVKELDARQAHIARDLHDAVGSSLGGIVMLVGSARAIARDPQVGALLETAYQHLKEAAERVRTIAHGMMPAGTEAGVFIEALEQFAAEISQTDLLHCTVHSRGDFSCVPPEAGTHLYRIVQEAVANALRHGHAREVRVVLVRSATRYRISIRDNGRGFESQGVLRRHPGIGLRSMQGRASAVAGHLRIRSRPGHGCIVQITWPVANEPLPPLHRAPGTTTLLTEVK